MGELLKNAPVVFGRVYTLAVVLISWVFFALEKPGEILAYLQAMFGLNGVGLMNTQAMFLGNEYLVLLINTKPEDCQEIQKRIDAQFRKKDTVYEIRYSVKSVRSLNNAKDDQSLS